MIRKTSIQCNIAEDLVDLVCRKFQFGSLRDALDNNNSVEIQDIGTFTIKPKKLYTELKKFEGMLVAYNNRLINFPDDEQVCSRSRIKIEQVEEQLVHLRKHENKLSATDRRLQEQTYTQQRIKREY